MLYISRGFRLRQSKLNHRFGTYSSHYDALGLTPEASFQHIKENYLSKSKLYHPDKKGTGSEEYHEIQEAYRVLKQPSSRKQYDLTLGIQHSLWEQEIAKENFKTSFESPLFEEILKEPSPTMGTQK